MPASTPSESHAITRRGKEIPVLAFFGTRGGVGKSTIARLFAELVTTATDRDGSHPNVLVVDFDVDHHGMTDRLMTKGYHRVPTVHEQVASGNAAGADAIDVSSEISLRAVPEGNRGYLHLIPAATREAVNAFQVSASVDLAELLNLLVGMIQHVVDKYDVSCVVMDCGPIVNSYTAAAAEIADRAFIIGRLEDVTYQAFDMQAPKIAHMYPSFHKEKIKNILNSVRNYDALERAKGKIDIFFDIPFVDDVIDASEGLANISQFRMLAFENYVTEFCKRALFGYPNLIPSPRSLLDDEWKGLLAAAPQLVNAPKVRWFGRLRNLRWVGALVFIVGLALFGLSGQLRLTTTVPPAPATVDQRSSPSEHAPTRLPKGAGVILMATGIAAFSLGMFCEKQRVSLLESIRKLQLGGPDYIFEQINKAPSTRANLEKLLTLSKTLAAHAGKS